MPRYFITAQTLDYQCGRIHVEMVSQPQEHLWLLYSVTKPSIIPRRDRRLNNTVPHQNNHTLWIDGMVEQNEPGQTILHTFDFELPGDPEVLFFYSINMGQGPTKQTRSAIFAYELDSTAIVGETWSNNGLPDLPWDYVTNPPTSPPLFRPGLATLYGNLAYTPLMRLNLEPYFGTTPNAFCDQFISIKLGNFLGFGPNPQFEIGTYVEFRNALGDTMSRNIYYDHPITACRMNYRNLVGLTTPNAIVTYNLENAYLNNTGVCRAGMDPIIPNAWPWRLTIYGAVSWPTQTTEIYNFTIGSIFLGTHSGGMTDISKYWRSRRLAPQLR